MSTFLLCNCSDMDINYNNTPLELLCYLTEEVGELAKEIRKNESNMQCH